MNAVFVNPGALTIASGTQIELGMMGLSEGLSPYSLFGGRSGHFSYAFGYFYDERIGPFRQGMVAGAAREVAPGAVFGASIKSQGGAEGFGVDADAGMLLRPRGLAAIGDWAVLGLAVRNLGESGIGHEPEGYRTLRSYAMSLGARREAATILFIPVTEPDASYELRAEGLDFGGFSHAFSVGAGFTPTGTLALRTTLRMPHEGSAQISAGGFLNFRLGAGGLRCGYTFSSGGFATVTKGPTHSFSLNMSVGTRADRQPPWVAVRADRVYLGSELPGHDCVHFRLRAADRILVGSGSPEGDDLPLPGAVGMEESKAPGEADAGGRGQLSEWNLVIFATGKDGGKQEAVKTFQGKDLPPRLIRWDGRDDMGAVLRPGYYAFRLAAKDKAGNRAETAWQLVEVGAGTSAELGGAPGSARQGPGPSGSGKAGHALPDSGESMPPIIEGEDD